MKKLLDLLRNNGEIVILIAIVGLAISQQYIGAFSFLLLFLGMMAYKIYKVFKVINPYSKDGMVAEYVRIWEKQQLGYDLDSDYWKDKKKPNLWHKFKGINPNWTPEENARWKLQHEKMKTEIKEEIDRKKLSKKRKVYK